MVGNHELEVRKLALTLTLAHKSILEKQPVHFISRPQPHKNLFED